MIVDARSLPEGEKIHSDVCIVGLGLAGITLATQLIDQHFKVCILESGGTKADPETQLLSWGENIGHPYFLLDTACARFLGGSVNRWVISLGGEKDVGARMRPLDPIDFEERDWVPNSGWPFRKEDLDPFYQRAQEICKIKPVSWEPKDWETADKSRLPLNGNIQTVLFKFGLRDSILNDHLKAVTHASNIETYLYANVIEAETDETAQNVTQLKVACLDGKRFSVSSKLYVLATNAIEAARLLLLSQKAHENGLGNQNDLVGRFFMEHPHCTSGVLIPSDPAVFEKTGFYNRIHKVNGVYILGKLAIGAEVIRREKLLNFVCELVPRIIPYADLGKYFYPAIASESVRSFRVLRSSLLKGEMPANFGGHVKQVLGDIDDILVTTFRNIRRKAIETLNRQKVKVFRLINMSEQVPNEMSRITLSSEKDRFGKNFVRLDWRLRPIDLRSIRRSQEILGKALNEAGLGKLYVELNDELPPEHITGGWHQMGTTRMHKDPRKGVLDENCKVHGVSNLYISGPSVFPTGGYANPSLTIVALSLRLSDHLKRIMF